MSIEKFQKRIVYSPDHKGSGRPIVPDILNFSGKESDEERGDAINGFITKGWEFLKAHLPTADAQANQGLPISEADNQPFTFSRELPLDSSDPATANLAKRFLYGVQPSNRPTLRYVPKLLYVPKNVELSIYRTRKESPLALPQLVVQVPLRLFCNDEDFYTMYPCNIVLVLYFEPSHEVPNHLIAKTRILSPWQSKPSTDYIAREHFWMRVFLERTHLPFDLFEKSAEQVSISSQGKEFIQCTDWNTLLKYYYGSVAEITEALFANGFGSSQVGFDTSKEAHYLISDMQTTGNYAISAPDLHQEVITRIPRCTYSKGATEYIIERETQTIELGDRAISIPSYTFVINQPVTSNSKLIGYIRRRVRMNVVVVGSEFGRIKLQITADSLEDKSTRNSDVKFFQRQLRNQSLTGHYYTAENLSNPYEGGLPGSKS